MTDKLLKKKVTKVTLAPTKAPTFHAKQDAPVTKPFLQNPGNSNNIERLLAKTLMHFTDEQSERERVLTDDVISPNAKYISSLTVFATLSIQKILKFDAC